MVRKGLRDSLNRVGITKIVEVFHKDHVYRNLEDIPFDLIIMSLEIEGQDTATFISEMRNGRLGPHPFAMTLMLLPVAEREVLAKVIDCGPDDLLLMPVAPGQVLARIEAMTHPRKPFVVTHNYTGPDRRKEKRPGTEEIPLIEGPNPLQARVTGMRPDQFETDMAEAVKRLNAAKLERYIVQMSWLDRAIHKLLAGDRVDEMVLRGHAMRLIQVAEDVPVRLPDSTGTVAKLASSVAACGNSLFLEAGDARQKALGDLPMCCARLAREINQRRLA